MELDKPQGTRVITSLADVAKEHEHDEIHYLRSFEKGLYHCTATLTSTRLSCTEVEDLFIAPMADLIKLGDYRSALHAGLEEYLTGSRLEKNAETMHRWVRSGLRGMRTDLRRLLRFLEDDAEQTQVTRTLRTANNDQATLYAREQLLTMKPCQLNSLCEQLGMPINNIGLWRRVRGQDRSQELRMDDLDMLGADSERLRSHLIANLFTQMDLLSPVGIETTRIRTDDLLAVPEPYSQHGFGEKQFYRGKESRDEWLPRWDVTFRSDGVVKREIVPVVSWSAGGERYQDYWARNKRFDCLGSAVQFDERTRTLTLFSPVVGMLSLAAASGSSLGSGAYRLFQPNYESHYANRVRRSGHARLPDIAAAAMPAVLMHPAYMHEVMNSKLFRNIHQAVTSPDGIRNPPRLRWRETTRYIPGEHPLPLWNATGQSFIIKGLQKES